MAVASEDRGKTRDGVGFVGHTVFSSGLVGEESGEVVVANTGRAKGESITGDATSAKVCRGEGSNGTSQRVAGDDNAVAGIVLASLLDGIGGSRLDLLPGCGEASVHLALRDEAAALPGENNIGDEVANVVASANGEDDVFVLVVDGDVAADASLRTTMNSVSKRARGSREESTVAHVREGVNQIGAIALEIGARSLASDSGVGSRVAVAVGCSGVLNVELEVGQVLGGDAGTACWVMLECV